MKRLMFWAAAACLGQALTASAAMETTQKILVYNEDASHYFMCLTNPDYAVTRKFAERTKGVKVPKGYDLDPKETRGRAAK